MNQTSDSPFPTSSSMGSTGVSSTGVDSSSSTYGGNQGTVQRMAQKAHEAVDKLEQTLGTGSEKVMGMQQEYGDMAREQVRANPIAAVAIAFGVGILFSKLFMR